MKKNKISTLSYFIKRLKDNQFVTYKIWDQYGDHDPRKWTILVDPGVVSVYITCYVERTGDQDFRGAIAYEFSDGGNRFPRNYSLKTDSIEVIVAKLIEKGCLPGDKK